VKPIYIVYLGVILFFLSYFIGKATRPSDPEAEELLRLSQDNSSTDRPADREESSEVVRRTTPLGNSDRVAKLSQSLDIFQLDSDALVALINSSKFDQVGFTDTSDTQLFIDCFSRLAEIDPKLAVDVAQALNPKQTSLALETVFKEWAIFDPDAALLTSLEVKDSRNQAKAMMYVFSSMAQEDPNRAFELIQTYGEPHPTLYNTITVITAKMAEQDPISALEAIDKASFESSRKKGLIGSLLNELAREKPEEAIGYLQKVESDFLKSSVRLSLITTFSFSNPDKALGLLNTDDTAYSYDELSRTITGLVTNRPAGLLEWIDSSYAGDDREKLFEEALTSWSKRDQAAARNYYESLPESDMKTRLVGAINLF
jgi:hypothetical protein